MAATQPAAATPVGGDVVRCWAGFASLGAGLVHLAVVHEHLAEWWVYGVFFAVVGAAQLAFGLGALGRDRAPLARQVACANLALVALWAVTRTTGLPVGPQRWTPEPVGRPDLLSVALEVATVLALAVLARAGDRPLSRRPPASASRYVALLFAGALAVSAMTTPALAATEAGGHAHPHGVHGR
jgi:hypothetical protein